MLKNQRSHLVKGLGILFLFLIYGVAGLVSAQQTIFNVPSTDVLDKGKVYGELDASLKPTDGSAVSKFYSFVPRLTIWRGASSNRPTLLATR